MTKYINKELLAKVLTYFPQCMYEEEQEEPALFVPEDDLLAVLKFLRDEEAYDFDLLSDLTAVDYQGYFEMVYHLISRRQGTWLRLKVKVDAEGTPTMPSITSLWESANFMEREVYDLMGIAFSGHPDLRRILLPDDFEGHPLRKDYPLPVKPKGGC